MHDTWKPVVGFEGIYEVSDAGQVRRLTYRNKQCHKVLEVPRILKPSINTNGYQFVQLRNGSTTRTVYIHRLVLGAFSGPSQHDQCAAHLNGQRIDNRHDNLIWASYKENAAHKRAHGTTLFGSRNPQSKLTESEVAEIRRMAQGGMSSYQIAPLFGVHDTNIRLIVAKKTWPQYAITKEAKP